MSPKARLIIISTNLFMVVLAAGSLAVGAWRAGELEVQARRASWLTLVEGEAKIRAQDVEASARHAAQWAEASPVVAYVRDGRRIAFDPAVVGSDPPVADGDELRYYLLSRSGGESYEVRGDPARAVDAYSFFLPRVRSPVLRARLRLSAAGAAEKAGNAALARALRAEVFETGAGSQTESGLPIDIVSALKLLEERGPGSEKLWRRLYERIESGGQRIPTHLLARVADALAPESGPLRGIVETRRIIEKGVEVAPEILSSREAAVVGESIVIAKNETVNGAPARTLRAARWLPPSSVLDDVSYAYDWTPNPPKPAEDGTASHPITLRDGGPVLGHVVVTDGIAVKAARRVSPEGRLISNKSAVVAQVFIILTSAAFLASLVRRERQLARLRERLLANVSHELKTPVTSVRMFAEMLGQPGLDPAEARHFAEHLRRESARLSQLLENLLDLSRPERAEARLAREPVDVRALLREVADGFGYRASEAGVEFHTEGLDGCGHDEAIVLETNGSAVERVVLNLLDNALKYRRAEASRVVLRLAIGADGLRVAVEDNGPGVSGRDRTRVFEEFYRGRFEDYGVKGAGLGLSIARRLARKLGGDVKLESREGAGSTFSLVLPRSAPPPKETAT